MLHRNNSTIMTLLKRTSRSKSSFKRDSRLSYLPQLVFFSSNTTTNLQPVDQLIKENLKRHYKKLLLIHRWRSWIMKRGLNERRQIDNQQLFREGQIHSSGDQNLGTVSGAYLDLGSSVYREKDAREWADRPVENFPKRKSSATGACFTCDEIANEILCSEELVESDNDMKVQQEGKLETQSNARVRSARQEYTRDPPIEDALAADSLDLSTSK
ncbi:hypothetical protein RF11_08225 [Thelohanellus kitauei]|uniref:Uncharacterized protein n=1 Tax=Thelohanellus kitauei TaxID=669202 RepID=A0A0C2JWL4_THEKT|nr:hypothetical protein RF11_08225 [Thelohanellus kitauei]